jgi:serine/threonine-protein kinase
MLGTFRIERLLGEGSMGEVYLAVDQSLGRKVALKLLGGSHRDSAELKLRFLREARAVAVINHPNVVQVFAVGDWEGRSYFVMEYLEGPDLARLLMDRGPLGDADAAAATLYAARGLAEAARRGVIHRDVKPSNLVVTDRGEVKVTDFGLAKATEIGPGLTQSGLVVGTPDYIAPEQARGESVDARADIYALGCTLFHLVAGRPPFRVKGESGTRYMEIVLRHLREPVPELARAAPLGCDAQLAELCRRMMAKDPAERPGYREVEVTLESVSLRLHGQVPQPVRVAPRPATSTQSVGRASRASARGSSYLAAAAADLPSWLWTVTALSTLVLLAGLTLHYFAR